MPLQYHLEAQKRTYKKKNKSFNPSRNGAFLKIKHKVWIERQKQSPSDTKEGLVDFKQKNKALTGNKRLTSSKIETSERPGYDPENRQMRAVKTPNRAQTGKREIIP